MKLRTHDVARRLGLPVSTIERWIRQGRIPVRRLQNACRFDQKELEGWARLHNLDFREEEPQESPDSAGSGTGITPVDLQAALHHGGICHGTSGDNIRSVLTAAVAAAPIGEQHRAAVLQSLEEREELASTGIGNGIAIPHPRPPLDVTFSEPFITTCFLEHPVDFEAIDGKPVFVLFLLLAPTVKIHLPLLSQLAFLLRDESFLEVLRSRPAGDALLAAVAKRSARLDRSRGAATR